MVDVKRRRTGFWVLVSILAIVHFPALGQSFVSEVQAAAGPRFEDSFAVSSLWAGQDWRIYVKGSDPDGEMDHIWVVVSQLGGNMWSNHVIRLKGQDRKAFAGYITLPVPAFLRTSPWEYLQIEMKIRDVDGRYSQAVTHELQIGSPTKITESLPQQWMSAENHYLGTIFFQFEQRRERESK